MSHARRHSTTVDDTLDHPDETTAESVGDETDSDSSDHCMIDFGLSLASSRSINEHARPFLMTFLSQHDDGNSGDGTEDDQNNAMESDSEIDDEAGSNTVADDSRISEAEDSLTDTSDSSTVADDSGVSEAEVSLTHIGDNNAVADDSRVSEDEDSSTSIDDNNASADGSHVSFVEDSLMDAGDNNPERSSAEMGSCPDTQDEVGLRTNNVHETSASDSSTIEEGIPASRMIFRGPNSTVLKRIHTGHTQRTPPAKRREVAVPRKFVDLVQHSSDWYEVTKRLYLCSFFTTFSKHFLRKNAVPSQERQAFVPLVPTIPMRAIACDELHAMSDISDWPDDVPKPFLYNCGA